MTLQSAIADDPAYRPVLDHGFVGLVDHMGDDTAIVQAARVSYGAGTKSVSSDRGLIRYLLRHQHTSPLEMCEVKLHVRAPILVARQWLRHRTASVNEESARYSEMSEEFYLPESAVVQPQSTDNKQGRAGKLDTLNIDGTRWTMNAAYDAALAAYRLLLGERSERVDAWCDPYSEPDPVFNARFPGIARELARTVMPLGAYTEFYWKQNLWNLFHFMKLRGDPHAQHEIRVYAEAIAALVQPLFPFAFEAFEDYTRQALLVSRMQRAFLTHLLTAPSNATEALLELTERHNGIKGVATAFGMTLRELHDCLDRFGMSAPVPPTE